MFVLCGLLSQSECLWTLSWCCVLWETWLVGMCDDRACCVGPCFFWAQVFYQEDNVSYQVCSTRDGEDSSCSDGLPITVSIPDHLVYLNYPLGQCTAP